MNEKHFLTKERLEELEKELAELKGSTRREISEQLAQAIQMGDLSENAAYDDALDRQSACDRRIAELEQIIHNASIIETGLSSNTINIGSKIRVETNEKELDFTIVGANEVNPGVGKISNESPLGKNFLGKKVGDVVEISVPKGVIQYKIISIS